MSKHTPTPWKFERLDGVEEQYRILKKELLEHDGYFRHNDGSWVINSAEGYPIASVNFKGTAKRGQAWHAPDPEGQANARHIVLAVNCHDEPLEALYAIKIEWPSLSSSTQHRIDAAIAKATGGQQ